MNALDYKLKLEEINRETKKTALKKFMSTYMKAANKEYRAVYDVDTYFTHSYDKAHTALQYFKLSKIALARWDNLSFGRKGLPDYLQISAVLVNINVTLENAVKLLEKVKDD